MSPKLTLQLVRNLANGADIHSSAKLPHLEIVEWKEQSLVFQAPSKATPGQLVSLVGEVTIDKKSKVFEATGRITSIVPEINKLNRFEIYLQQYDKVLWKAFLEALGKKQNRADKIFDSIRGEE